MKKPNILFIVTDDQRYDTIHALGNDEIITPNLDELVRRGTSFSNAYIPCGLTGAVCMPSRAMLNTGRNLYDLEGNGESIPTNHTLLGEHLKSNGYHAFGSGKWHNGPQGFTRSFCEGENAFFSGMWDHWNVPTCTYDPTGEYDNVIKFVANFYKSKDVMKVHCDRFHPGVHSTTLLTDTTIDFLKNHEGNEPFYCYTAYLAPHDPRTMPTEFLDMYEGRDLTLPSNFMAEYPVAYGETCMRDELLVPYPRTEERILSELKDYYAMITHLDHEIGRIISALKAKGLYEDTLIVLCGDNGLAVGSHGFMGKQNHFEHSLKVPLIFSGPGVPCNHQVSAKVYLFDIYPTLCEMLGLDIPRSVTGRSFLSCFHEEKEHREKLYFSYGATIRSIRVGDYKLCEYIGEKNERSSLLYNVVEDPMELSNLYAEDKATSDALRQELMRTRYEVGDTDRPESISFWSRYE